MNNKGADQSARMCRLVCTFVIHKPLKTDFLELRPIYEHILDKWIFSMKFYIVKSGWSISFIEGSQVKISKNIIFLPLKIKFVLENSAHPGVMLNYATFDLSLYCFPKYLFKTFWSFTTTQLSG